MGGDITSNYLIGGLTVFLQRHVCEMDLETSEKVMASFLFLSCSPTSSFFVLPFSVFFFWIWIKSTCLIYTCHIWRCKL